MAPFGLSPFCTPPLTILAFCLHSAILKNAEWNRWQQVVSQVGLSGSYVDHWMELVCVVAMWTIGATKYQRVETGGEVFAVLEGKTVADKAFAYRVTRETRSG